MDFMEAAALTEDQARDYLEAIRWPNGPVCPHCGESETVVAIQANPAKRIRAGLKRCKACRKQFTVTVGTIFEGSHVSLKKWILAFHIVCASKKGVSAKQLERQLKVTYKTAWFMAHRIRYAMTQEPLKGLLQGTVEVDETFVGGKPRHTGGGRGKGSIRARKTPVVALIARDGEMRTRVVPSVSPVNLRKAIADHVDPAAILYSDGWMAYRTIAKERGQEHEWVDHTAKEYARGPVHVNTAESFFGLLKRGIHGSYHHVSRKHLHRYCEEFTFRWNTRHLTDGHRAEIALGLAPGKRLKYHS